jgi:chromosome segregation ATPase
MVNTEKDAHDRTVKLLEASELEVKKLQIETTSLRTEITREKEARNAIEDMLQNYKEEVDTLNEALKIAAMDIAEVAQTEDDFALSEEGDDSEDEDDESVDAQAAHGAHHHRQQHHHQRSEEDDEGFVDAAPSRFSKAGNKSNVMRAVMEDSSVQSRGSTLTGASSHNYGSSTFLVHEDGTFEQK